MKVLVIFYFVEYFNTKQKKRVSVIAKKRVSPLSHRLSTSVFLSIFQVNLSRKHMQVYGDEGSPFAFNHFWVWQGLEDK